MRERLSRVDDRTFELQGQYDQAIKKADKSGKPEDLQAAERLHRQLTSALSSGTAFSEKIQALRHPSELQRRVNDRLANQQSIRRLRMAEEATTPKKPTPKDQGFPDAYLSDNGKFRIGMDARAKSDLVASALGLVTTDSPGSALHVFTPKEAEKLLEARGWTGFLDRKRQIIADADAAKAKRATEREAAAKAKAEEKAAAKAKADSEKATSDKASKTTSGKGGSTSKDLKSGPALTQR